MSSMKIIVLLVRYEIVTDKEVPVSTVDFECIMEII